MIDIDCAAVNKAVKLARQNPLYDLAKQILAGSYTPGIQDRILLDELKNKKDERTAEQSFKIVAISGKFLVAYHHGGFLGKGFKKESDALVAIELCQEAFKAGEYSKMQALHTCLGAVFVET